MPAMNNDNKGPRDFEERVIDIKRCAKVVKGGRRFSFSALVIAGDRNGRVGYALAKANEATDAIRKGTELAKRNMVTVTRRDSTIPHEVTGRFCGGQVLLKPASEGTGIIAGGPMRAVFEVMGVTNVLAKCLGSTNPYNVVRATIHGLTAMNTPAEIAAKRSKSVEEILG